MTRSATYRAIADVVRERNRQEVLKLAGRFAHTCADTELSHLDRLAILAEEFGDVARAILEMGKLANDVHGADLRKGLVQVAAVAVAWAESLERGNGG